MKRRFLLKGLMGVGSILFLSPISCDVKSDEITDTEINRLIATIADSILPETSTPGALSAGVPAYIMEILQNFFDEKHKQAFLHGLREIQRFARSNYQLAFDDCSKDVKHAILEHFESGANYRFHILNKIRDRLFGPPFINVFKQLTVTGYCTSQIGACEGLAYDAIPGNFESCILIDPNQQRSWATK